MKISISIQLFVISAVFGASGALANQSPAARTCRIAGGQPWDINIPGDQVELCIFSDSSLIEADTLARGSLSPENRELTNQLRSRK